MRRLRRVFLYVLSFGLVRGALFGAPIVLANLLSPADYGSLEFVQAVGSMGAALFALGTAGVVPLVLVRKLNSVSWGGVLLHQSGCVVVLAVVALVSFASGREDVVWLSAVGIGVLMLQSLWSVTLKSHGHGEASLLLDAGFWGLLALAALVAYGFSVPVVVRWDWVVVTLVGYFAALGWWTIRCLARARQPNTSWLYVPTVRAGVPLMLGALLSFLATTSGRLGVGLLSTPEMLADYAVLFRATALPMVAHQLIVVARFRQIFQLPETELARRLPVVVGLVAASVVVFWLVSDVIGVLLGPAFLSAFSRHRSVGLLILIQCILWSAIALNDLVNARSQSVGAVARASGLYVAAVFPLVWWFLSSRHITLSLFVPVHSAVMAGYFLTQVVVMWYRGVRLLHIWVLTLVCFIGLSALTQLV